MNDDDSDSDEVLALVERLAGAVRGALGADADVYPGAGSPERADPLNRAFRAAVRAVAYAPDPHAPGVPARVSRLLRRGAERRLAADGWGPADVRRLLDEEPGGPDDWLCFLLLADRSQIDPVLRDAADDAL